MKAEPICSPFVMKPRKLITVERLDIVVKWRYFRHLLRRNDPDSERVYRWHIKQRTRGNEPRSWKSNIEDYITVCKDLYKSMFRNGYNPEHPLKYGRNGKLMCGAHRLACSLALDVEPVCVIYATEGNTTWDEDWFIDHGIDKRDLQQIKADWKHLKKRKK
jgi:hypothetical protein